MTARKSMASFPVPSLIAFGPSTSWPSKDFLKYIRRVLLGDQRLYKFAEAIRDLPNAWLSLVEIEPALSNTPGLKYLESLSQWVKTGILSPANFQKYESADAWDSIPPNTLLSPLTVIIHIVQYFEFLQLWRDSGSRSHVRSSSIVIEGFCTGQIAAQAVALSSSEDVLLKMASRALRLAAGMGALIDLDGIWQATPHKTSVFVARWSSPGEKERLREIVASIPNAYVSVIKDECSMTITVPESMEGDFISKSRAANIKASRISLRGQFHTSANRGIYDTLKSLCDKREEFDLPPTKLHRHRSAETDSWPEIEIGFSNCDVLDAILISRCDWASSITKAVLKLPNDTSHTVLEIGLHRCVPTQLANKYSLNVIPGVLFKRAEMTASHGMKAKVPEDIAQEQTYSDDAIAIIGMGCRFPGSNSVDEFWEVIKSGISTLSPFPEARFQHSQVIGKGELAGNFIREPEIFDHKFFNISPREAASMDPQQRLALQVAYEALQSSGYFRHENPASKNTGCYLGVAAVDYQDNVDSNRPGAFSLVGTVRAFISARVSHHFGWTGPSLTLDTACSSSLVAIHQACKDIRSGDCDMALAGGVNVITSPFLFNALGAANFTSRTSGQCKPFDEKADGYCRGEGCGLIVLKRLSLALEQNDKVLAVIPSSAINQSENGSPITVPHSDSQVRLFQQVVNRAGVAPNQVSYLEAHGTGTPKGDPIEMESIRRVFGVNRVPNSPLVVGSVKGNIGHLEAASGAAALIKTVLMIQEKTIPPLASFKKLNPYIGSLHEQNIEIAVRSRPWNTIWRAACISNYGAAGSNACVLICQPPPSVQEPAIYIKANSSRTQTKEVFHISARTKESLKAYCRTLNTYVANHDGPTEHFMSNLAFNLAYRHNPDQPYSVTVAAPSIADLQDKLREIASSKQDSIVRSINQRRPVVLCFGGQRKDYIALSKSVYENCALLRHHLRCCEKACTRIGYGRIFPHIFDKTPISNLVDLHCCLFAVQYSCARAWLDSGLTVDALVGHSFGQLSALCISGVMSLQDTLLYICKRAELINSRWGPEKGTMLSVETDKVLMTQVMSAISKQGLDVQVACYNTPSTHVLSGAREAIMSTEKFIHGMQANGTKISCRMLSVTHGYHSQLVGAITPEIVALAKTLHFHTPTIPVELCNEKQFQGIMTPEELASHSQRPVFFTNAISRLAKRFSSACWIEAGSDSGIMTLVKRNLATESPKSHHVCIPMPLHSEATLDVISDSVVSLLQEGVHVRHWAHHTLQNQQYDYLNLPCYQFERPRHWLEYKSRSTPASSDRHTDEKFQDGEIVQLISSNNEQGARFGINTNADDFVACTTGHAVLGNALCPASLYIEMATRAAKLLLRDTTRENMVPQIEDLQMSSPLSITSAQPVELHLTRDTKQSSAYTFRIFGNAFAPTDKQVDFAQGTVALRNCSLQELLTESRRYKRLVDLKRCQELLDNTKDAESIQGHFIYDQFGPLVDYNPCYRGLRRVASLDGNVAGLVHMHFSRVAKEAVTHPLAVDNFTQVAGFYANIIQNRDKEYMFLCTAIGRISMYSDLRQNAPAAGWLVFCTVEATPETTGLESDIYVLNSETGMVDAILFGVQFAKVRCSSFRRLLEPRGPHVQAKKPAPNGLNSHGNTLHVVTNTEIKTESLKGSSFHDRSNTRDSQLGIHYFKIVQDIIAEVMQVPLVDILMTSDLIELGIDSLVGIELLTEISIKIGTTLSTVDFASLGTVGDLISIIKSTCADKEITLKPLVDEYFKRPVQWESATAPLTNGTSTNEDCKPNQHERVSQTISMILSELLDLAPDAMTLSLHLENAGLDSLLSIELFSEIERKLDVKIHSSELVSVILLSDLVKLVQDRTLSNGPDRDDSVEITSSIIHTQLSNGQTQLESTHTIVPVFSKEANAHETTPSLIASPGKIFASMQPSFPQLAEQTKFAAFFESVYPAQRDLVVSYVVEALSDLGCSLTTMPPDTQVEIPRVVSESKHSRLVPRLMKILEEAGLVYKSSSGLSRSQKLVSVTHSSDLYQELLSAFPAFALEHRLLNAMGSKLGPFLTGQTDPLHVLFSENKQLSADVYAASPLFATPTHILSTYLAALFGQVRSISHGSTKPVIRILELGAGTGGTTAVVLDMLEKIENVVFEYTFTDLSPSFLHHAKRRFSSHSLSSNIVYSIVDIETEPPASLRSSFDIIFASNCIHATRSLHESCSHIRMMLRSKGIMCLIELMRPLGWLDLVYGPLDGWWRFSDERQYPLVSEVYWRNVLREAGFKHVDWSGRGGEGLESTQIRVLLGCVEEQESVENLRLRPVEGCRDAVMETIRFACVGGVELFADIYYPKEKEEGRRNTKTLMDVEKRPVALLIHGGGHIMLSRTSIPPSQLRILLDKGFLPISIDYRLCPEVALEHGAMSDVLTALQWIRRSLPFQALSHGYIRPNGRHVVAVGWSTGGMLAMSLGWTAATRGVQAPDAVLAFYSPTNYADESWRRPIFPNGTDKLASTMEYVVAEGLSEKPLTAYHPKALAKQITGGWMATGDVRSRIALHMNWKAQTLPILLGAFALEHGQNNNDSNDWGKQGKVPLFPQPSEAAISRINPYAQIVKGSYTTPICLLHGSLDDLVSVSQARDTAAALQEAGVESKLLVVEGARHLFDSASPREVREAVEQGYMFVASYCNT
ncbi:unnamed protein product [Periconia digitata]|uniref:Polyketide synthase n=1 Tax=Periconia digitata TaxID=1303443 RepID=A0A9W4UVC1_9PLEO|nr:unnamed protein product [Periconia digitata]